LENFKSYYMKLFAIFFFLLPIAAVSQTTKDYEHAMAKFQKFYNAGQGDSINAMFGHFGDETQKIRSLWTNEINASSLEKYGTLKSFKFIGIDTTDPDKVYVFKTVFSKKGAMTSSLTLYKDNKLGDFRFPTILDKGTKLMKINK